MYQQKLSSLTCIMEFYVSTKIIISHLYYGILRINKNYHLSLVLWNSTYQQKLSSLTGIMEFYVSTKIIISHLYYGILCINKNDHLSLVL